MSSGGGSQPRDTAAKSPLQLETGSIEHDGPLNVA